MGKGTLQFTKNFASPIYHWKVSIFFDLFVIDGDTRSVDLVYVDTAAVVQPVQTYTDCNAGNYCG